MELIAKTGPVVDHIADKALETYGIAAHYDSGHHDPLWDSEPLRHMIETVSRSAVAVALARLTRNHALKLTEYQADQLIVMATGLDLIAVETDAEPAPVGGLDRPNTNPKETP